MFEKFGEFDSYEEINRAAGKEAKADTWYTLTAEREIREL